MPEASLRAALRQLSPTAAGANVGLWLDRFLPEQLLEGEKPKDNDEHPHTKQFRQAAEIGEPSGIYQRFYHRWEQNFTHLPQYEDVKTGFAEARSRVVVGLGADGILENAITLHRAYGVPYIPGSALKGVAAAYAHRRLADPTWRKEVRTANGELVTAIGDAHKIVFGDTTIAGYITFFDALYVPGSSNGRPPLEPDVLTVHHPNYYQGGESPEAPADWDSPTPITFLSATGTFLIALAGPKLWVETVYDLLALALDEFGVGGKTAAGYGRLDLDGLAEARARLNGQMIEPIVDADPEAAVADALIGRINALAIKQVSNEINKFYQEAKALSISPGQRARIATAIITKVREAGHEKNFLNKDKGWYKEVIIWLEAGEAA